MAGTSPAMTAELWQPRSSSLLAIWSPTGATNGRWIICSAAMRPRPCDQHAPDFDQALLDRLDYRAPELLLDAVRPPQGQRFRLGSVLDLGCGTGLGGAAFRPYCDWLAGVDISSGMVELARVKGLYDRLVVADLMEFLATESG